MINSPDTYGYSPLQSACSSKNGDERIIARLLEVPGVDVRTPIKTDQNTALHYFCQNYKSPLDVDDLFHHFIKLGADVNARNGNNETAIFKAIFNNAIKLLLVEKLLEAGADVNIYSHSHGEGVLHYACRLQRADLTMAFLKAGADVKVRGKEGKTPYELAVMHPELQQMAQIIQSTEQMVDWLEANGIGAVKKAFQKAELTKDKLPGVKKHMLEEMGIADKELRSKTYKAIKALKKSTKESPDAKPAATKVMTKEEADSAKALAKILAQLESLKIDRKDWIIDANDLEFTKKLGSGAAGDVFKGLYKNQQVAIKVLKESMEEKELSEFKKELAIISSVKSPHTVYFFGAALGPKKLCMVMELCARGSLCDVMKDKDIKLGWSLALDFAVETTLGLTALHTHQPMIVHRDLKSLNLLVTQDMHVKVCDFGLSRFDTQANDETLHQLRGTMAFCAPEVYHSSKFTPKSDVYSLVLVLWELVNRVIKGFYEAPYSEFKHLQYDFQIIIQVAKKNLRPTIPASCPEPVKALLKSGMDADPDKRSTLAEIVEQLQGFKKQYSGDPAAWDAACLPLPAAPPAAK
jgi:serine/threonine protein kinase